MHKERIRSCIVVLFSIYAFSALGQEISIGNTLIKRTFRFEKGVWKTISFSTANNSVALNVNSDEFHILPMNASGGLTIRDFQVNGAPKMFSVADTQFLQIAYRPLPSSVKNAACPAKLVITYFVVNNQPFLRKKIQLQFNAAATVDRLEIERFIADGKQSGGGRGEPVFIDNTWFTGLEYPGGYSRHTNGNTPKSYGRTYDAVGNYSFIDLEGRDKDADAVKGMIRLMHFPGFTVNTSNKHIITSKTSVTGCAGNNQSVSNAFMQYLQTLWKPNRPFLNYNNWFDRSAKDLSGENFVNVYRKYKKVLAPFNISIDGMIPDDGWQNRNSIWLPSETYFPKGDEDLTVLSRKLQQEGTRLGLWLSLNSYNNNIDWGIKQGYSEAKRNLYFSSYNRYFSLSATKYKSVILKRIPELAKKANLIYYKHDFNELCDIDEGNNHPPTDRHGHEANLDVAIEILTATRKVQPDIIQNLTNWVWMSPWWLQYADYLWMLAGDDGENGNTPELSSKAMSTTDRDTYLWRLYGDGSDRPLVPVSRLMTHGVLQTAQNKNISLEEWMDYVLMYYGRGTLLQEWYITFDAMNNDRWKALASVHNWSKTRRNILDNMNFVGGRPDEGNVYGYMGWSGDSGLLVTRNPSAHTQIIKIPFNSHTGYSGQANILFKGTVSYPYQEDYPAIFTSGKEIEIEVPGYTTLVIDFAKGENLALQLQKPSPPAFTTTISNGQNISTRLAVPADIGGRCELLIIGYPAVPTISIDGKEVTPSTRSKAKLNHFAWYAVSGMPSSKAIDWKMEAYDLAAYAGREIEIRYTGDGKFECHLLVEQKVKTVAVPGADKTNLWLLKADVRRKTIQLY